MSDVIAGHQLLLQESQISLSEAFGGEFFLNKCHPCMTTETVTSQFLQRSLKHQEYVSFSRGILDSHESQDLLFSGYFCISLVLSHHLGKPRLITLVGCRSNEKRLGSDLVHLLDFFVHVGNDALELHHNRVGKNASFARMHARPIHISIRTFGMPDFNQQSFFARAVRTWVFVWLLAVRYWLERH